MRTRTVATRSLAAIVLALVMTLAVADPATAADSVELSSDGASYAPTVATPLFPSVGELVPGDSRQATFWVRNSSSFDTYLRVSIDGTTYSDLDYATMLTVQGGVPGTTGPAISVASTATCRVLFYGVELAPSEEVEVTVVLQLGDLSGSDGQLANVSMTLGVTLDQAAGSASDGCAAATPVPVVVTPGGGAGAVAPPAAEADGEAAPAAPSEPSEPRPPFEALGELLSNTFAGFDSRIVGWAGAAGLAGALAYLGSTALRARREAALNDPTTRSTAKEDIS